MSRHPDSERRPEPSIILRYLLQLESPTLHSLQAAHGVPTAATELGADVSAGEYLHPDLQEIYLRYANSGAHNDIGPEGGSKKNSCVSKQVLIMSSFITNGYTLDNVCRLTSTEDGVFLMTRRIAVKRMTTTTALLTHWSLAMNTLMLTIIV